MKKITILVSVLMSMTAQVNATVLTKTSTPLERLETQDNACKAEAASLMESQLIISEIFSGQSGDDLTVDWFEIENTGTTAYVQAVDGDLYYDDESADASTADIITGITQIAPGESAIVLLTDVTTDVDAFIAVWGAVVDLTGIEIGMSDGAGLGAGGDAVNIWLGDPTASEPIATGSYPDTDANDGQSFDVTLNAFSVEGNSNHAVVTTDLGGDGTVPNIGSPGNVAPVLIDGIQLIVSEIFSGQTGDDLTVDWFEIENTGTTAYVQAVDGDLYYDDESADATTADVISGITEIAPGKTAIVLITDTTADVDAFVAVWSPVIDLTGVSIGISDGAGLGAGGDAVNIWLGDPTASEPLAMGAYPDTDANDGQTYDITLDAFSVEGNANGAVTTNALGGDDNVPNIGSPGNGLPVETIQVQFDGAFTSVSEDGTSVDVTLLISDVPAEDTTVDVVLKSGGTAVANSDFTFAATQTVTFPAGSAASQTVTVPIVDNNEDGSDVFFVLGLDNVTNGDTGIQDTYVVYVLDDDTVVPAGDATQLDASYLPSYLVSDGGTAEITTYDPLTETLFVVNNTAIEVLDFSDPTNISSIATVDITTIGAGAQSVAVNNGILAIAIANFDETQPGFVAFSDTSGNEEPVVVQVGVLPDMLTFSPDGTKLLVANEGQPSADYSIDPEGTVSIIDVSGGLFDIDQTDVTNVTFNAFDGMEADLNANGIRVFGPNATASQDFEPEYIAVSGDSETAYVVLQENNAYAIIDITTATVTDVISFGLKDHSLPENSLDTSDESDFVFNAAWPIKGMYMPDAITLYTVAGVDYLVTANEGDVREYDGYIEEAKVDDAAYVLDPTAFSDINVLELATNLGEIVVSAASGDVDNDGDFDEIHVFGGRSFSIFEAATGSLVYDSANDFEVITAADPVYGPIFNASNSNNNLKNRSDNKGPEPEGVIVQEIDGEQYAFVLLERVGGVMIYNVTDPATPVFLQYLNNRSAVEGGDETGDLGPEGIIYISPEENSLSKGLIVIANEVSATLSVIELNADVLGLDEVITTASVFTLHPNPATDTVYFSKQGSYTIYDVMGRVVLTTPEVASVNVSTLNTGTYIVTDTNGNSQKLIVK
ncbi:CHU large protein [unidentified eubacterium SCB49]|nr:CHU large protein [unidentified eubacterium SCB49]